MNQFYNLDDRIVALITPTGTAAISVIRISGNDILQPLDDLFHFSNRIDILTSLKHARAILANCKINGRLIDQVLLTFFRAPRSYTGDDILEISTHGNPIIVKEILRHILNLADQFRMASPGEFTYRAFLNGKLSLSQAESVAEVIESKTQRLHSVAMLHLTGTFHKKVIELENILLDVLANIEVRLDHSDDDTIGMIASQDTILSQLNKVNEQVSSWIQNVNVGKIFKHGFKVGIIGKPNTGKSSLINCLLKTDRSIVTETAGTTRDTIEEWCNINELPIQLIDTAGIHDTDDTVEKIGIKKAMDVFETSDFMIIVLDGSCPFSIEDQRIADLSTAQNKTGIVLLNKSDLARCYDLDVVRSKFPLFFPLSTSLLHDLDIKKIVDTLYDVMTSDMIPLDDMSIITSERQINLIQQMSTSLEHALQLFNGDVLEECLAIDIQGALNACNQLLGRSQDEDILDKIFSNFCIGK